ncbi:hypothetical protein CKM354_000048700 [Cercospora kikuchii]|uniref:glucan 1,3-beta-glucosidase n=1 Tax=Cercospora kikuchii TaxID=84275 RepID=A0A9P3C5X1_9PEZI|nr:uncharacterized protein CKM354_000048700 [Cercospora kikuchii]GIZ37024.1 hypothetical protein CKM354_000048700 [Cercospora kikuchii]
MSKFLFYAALLAVSFQFIVGLAIRKDANAKAIDTSIISGHDAAAHNTRASSTQMIRGVNIGSWLVLEKWMVSGLFEGTNATDQYTFDSTQGAEAKLRAHWETYFTEADVRKIASWGINALRIPVGYWSYDNSGTPYITGADAYLEKAIGWARTHGLKVVVDCHGSPGSQNGFDNSGQSGNIRWQSGDNLDKSISVLKIIAQKYGSKEYADVVLGLQLVNEPASWGDNNFDITKEWTQKAYHAVRAAATNPNLLVVMHDSFKGPWSWVDVGQALNGNALKSEATFSIDTHLYQNQQNGDSWLNQDQHIQKACDWTQTDLLPAQASLPVFIGEFSAQTNICAFPNGSTVAGSKCDVDGCQCSCNVDVAYWKPWLVNATRKFLEAELDAFEHSSQAWFMWSYKGPGAWGLENLVKYGVIGAKVTERMFPGQCLFS